MPTSHQSSFPIAGLTPEAAGRLRRLKGMAWLLDRSIPLGGGRRIGLDPIIGLVPGLGDWVGALMSVYVLYQAARLGLPMRVLGQIALNIGIESLVGAVPIAGDVFDAVYQANMRNLRLVERHYRPELRARSFGRIWLALGLFVIVLLTLLGLAVWGIVKLIAGGIALAWPGL